MLLGLTDPAQYDNSELETLGEVAVLNLDQGIWSRVLPSCDPTSTPACPTTREGAAIVSSGEAMVGGNIGSSDILVFGGRARDGTMTNELWLLRATNATISRSDQTDWGPNFGDGELGSGIYTNGKGVTVKVSR